MRPLPPFLCLLVLLFAGKAQAADLLSSILDLQAHVPGAVRTGNRYYSLWS